MILHFNQKNALSYPNKMKKPKKAKKAKKAKKTKKVKKAKKAKRAKRTEQTKQRKQTLDQATRISWHPISARAHRFPLSLDNAIEEDQFIMPPLIPSEGA